MAEERWIVAGLGNPGPDYAGNRHNAGHMVAALLAERMGARFKAHRSRNEVAEGRLAGVPVTLAKPRTYMNTSGGPVASLAGFYKIPPGRIVVIHDELDLPFGTVRLKLGGGDNGHNGLRSVTAALGPAYYRARFGIGRPPGRMDPAAFVLRDFSAAERRELPLAVDRCADAVEALLSKGLAAAQNLFHAGLGAARVPASEQNTSDLPARPQHRRPPCRLGTSCGPGRRGAPPMRSRPVPSGACAHPMRSLPQSARTGAGFPARHPVRTAAGPNFMRCRPQQIRT